MCIFIDVRPLYVEERMEFMNILRFAKNGRRGEMGRLCSTHGSVKKWRENFCRKTHRERSFLGNLDVNWDSTTMYFYKNCMRKYGLD